MRASVACDGQVSDNPKHELSWVKDGFQASHPAPLTHLVMSPLEFMQRLAALMPRPRLRLQFASTDSDDTLPIPTPAGECCRAAAAECSTTSTRMAGKRVYRSFID